MVRSTGNLSSEYKTLCASAYNIQSCQVEHAEFLESVAIIQTGHPHGASISIGALFRTNNRRVYANLIIQPINKSINQ